MALRVRVVCTIVLMYTLYFLSKEISSGMIFLRITPETKRQMGYPRDFFYLNFTTRSSNYGYITDEHTVTTDDGYLLTMFHMHRSRKCFGSKYPPVVMMHGLLMSSDTWLDAGPGASLAYLLSDACFDLWLGNVRGNYYGKRHTQLNPDKDPEFWDFSADEMGLFDISATIDYVLKETGADQVNYIGYSQGAGTLLMMCSERPGHCGKVRSLIALAPATRLKHTRSLMVRQVASQLRILESVLRAFGVKEVFSQGGFGQEIISFICKYKTSVKTICKTGLAMLDSEHEGSIKWKTFRILYDHFPAGTSVRTFVRYSQALYSEGYRKYDHGETKNLQVYGTTTAPFYNLSAVHIPTFIVHGSNDYLVDPEDVRWLAKSLPNVLERVEIEDPMWNHVDFMYSQHIKKLVLPQILKHLLKYSEVN